MSFIAFIGFQGVNSLTPVSLRSASGCFLASSAGGETSIWVCLLELSSTAILSERGGLLRLSCGAGADYPPGPVRPEALAPQPLQPATDKAAQASNNGIAHPYCIETRRSC